MKYKILGKTNLNVSEIVLGGGAVGGIIFKNGFESGLHAVKQAMDSGINWIDSAPAYGGGKSEEYIGNIIKELNIKPFISTKIIFGVDDINDIETAAMKSIEKSLKTLSIDRVDVLQLHNQIDVDKSFHADSITEDDLFKKNGILDSFQKIKDRGLASNIGFTGIGKATTLLKAIDDGRFDMFQAYINLLNPSALYKAPKNFDQFDYAQIIKKGFEKNMGIVAIRTFAAGVLAGAKGIPDTPPLAQGAYFPKEYERLHRMQNVLSLTNEQTYRLSLQLVYLSEEIGVSALGFAELKHMTKALETIEKIDIDADMLEEFRQAFESGQLI